LRLSAGNLPWLLVSLLVIGTGRSPAFTRASGRDWRARWVWVGGGSDGSRKNLYADFRRTFHLEELPGKAEIFISADSRYVLWVNGKYVGRGPARCDPSWQQFDSYDILPFLGRGENVIAALVHYYGAGMAWYIPGRPGFIAEAVLESAGRVNRLATGDRRWKAVLNPAYKTKTPRSAIGFQEVYDARRRLSGWRNRGFDDSAWSRPVPLKSVNRRSTYAGIVPIEPWFKMVPRSIPYLEEYEVTPVRVVEVGIARDDTSRGEDLAKRMFLEKLAADPEAVSDPEALLKPDGLSAIINPPGPGRSVYVVLDFGREVTGRYRLKVADGANGTMVDIGTSEWLVPPGETDPYTGKRVDPGERGRVYSVKSGGQVKRVILADGPLSWESFDWRGFRYMQVNFRNLYRPIKVDAVTVGQFNYPTGNRGGFRCSDELLNRIWQAGAYTLKLCMHDAYEDCPSREQRQWVGDAFVEMMINFACFGDVKLAAQFLRQVAQSQKPDGMTAMYYPGGSRNVPAIPDYNLLWIIGIDNYLLYTGDVSLARELFPAVEKSLRWWSAYLDDDGLLRDVPGWVFIDWADLVKVGKLTSLNALYAGALQAAASLAEKTGRPGPAEEYRAAAAAVQSALNRFLWDSKRGVYCDAILDGRQSRLVSQQANGLALYFGLPPAGRWTSIVDYITEPKRVKPKLQGRKKEFSEFNEDEDVVLAQPFSWFFLAQGLDRAGYLEIALENFRKRWGRMLQGDTTTLWETWELSGSACHGWSGAPTFVLSTAVLGVKPLEPGFVHFRVAPQPVDLDWAEGVFPSPRGDIPVKWARTGRGFDLSLVVPDSTTAEAAVPAPPKADLETNGKTAWFNESPAEAVPGLIRVYRQGGWLVAVLRPGSYKLALRP